jgi:hypothetical protein
LFASQSFASLSAQSETDFMITVFSNIQNSRAVLATAYASISATSAQVSSLNCLDLSGLSMN